MKKVRGMRQTTKEGLLMKSHYCTALQVMLMFRVIVVLTFQVFLEVGMSKLIDQNHPRVHYLKGWQRQTGLERNGYGEVKHAGDSVTGSLSHRIQALQCRKPELLRIWEIRSRLRDQKVLRGKDWV